MARENRTITFEVRITPTEARKLQRASLSAHMTQSQYVRHMIFENGVKITQLNIDGEKLDAALLSLKRSSGSINQLMHAANRGMITDAEAAAQMVAAHKAAAEKLSALIDETRGCGARDAC